MDSPQKPSNGSAKLLHGSGKDLTGSPMLDDISIISKALADRTDSELEQVVRDSAQTRGHMGLNQTWLDSGVFMSLAWRQKKESDIAPYGNLARDITLRRMLYLTGNNIVQAAVSTISQKIQATEYTMTGPLALVKQWIERLRQADLGNGWNAFVSKCVTDWLTQDNGMFWELIGPSDPVRYSGKIQYDILGYPIPDTTLPLNEVWGLAHLDASRCWRTSSWEYPVLYYDLNGGVKKLHRSRVIYEADQPSPNERWRGRGFCALSRLVDICQTLINIAEYRNEMLDDLPPLGYMIWSNINKDALNDQVKEHELRRASREEYVYSPLLNLFGMSPDKAADAKFIPLRQVWEGFNERQSFDLYIDIVAMCMGVDRQELAPLMHGNIGSGHQSEVLQQKARGKGVGTLLVLFERMINAVLPDAVSFRFQYQDIEQDMQRAQVQQIQAATVVSLFTAVAGQKPGGGPTLLPAEGSAKLPEKPTAAVKAAPQDSTGQTATTPAGSDPGQNVESEPLITRDEARHVLMRIGLLDPEVVNPITSTVTLNDTTEEVTQKVRKRFGPTITIDSKGTVKQVEMPQFSVDEVSKARKLLEVLDERPA